MNSLKNNDKPKFLIWWQVKGCEPETTDVTFDSEQQAQFVCTRLNENADGDYIKYWVEPVSAQT